MSDSPIAAAKDQALRVVPELTVEDDRPRVVPDNVADSVTVAVARPVKRLLDLAVSTMGLVAASPVLAPVTYLVWRQDRANPFYVAARVGLGDRDFKMVKLRSMVTGADKTGVDSTAAGDSRITPVGHFIRRYKLDEVTQLWNVARGEMSLVGPRPNVRRETDLYTREERRLLTVKPGITDFASIVFSDEADILNGQTDPDVAYNQLIRPGKSELGLFYIDHQSTWLDIRIVALTAVAIVNRERALNGVGRLLRQLGAPGKLIETASRRAALRPTPPPGSTRIVTSRDGDPLAP